MKKTMLVILGVFLLNGCQASDTDRESLSKEDVIDGKADQFDVCPFFGLEEGCDLCEALGWYGDGECDQELIDEGLCVGPDPDCGPTDGDDGTEGAALETCNDGALLIEPSAERAGELVATVTDQGIVEWFIEQSERTSVRTVDYSGASREVTLQHEMPWMVSIVESTEGRLLVVRDLRPSGDGYSTSGPGGVTIRREGQGLRLTISGQTMPFSHAVIYYEVGQWFFESCGAGDEELDLWTCWELENDLFMECRDEGDSNAECIEGPQRDLWMASVEACCAVEPGRHFCDLIQ
jgi:hypothetical protein